MALSEQEKKTRDYQKKVAFFVKSFTGRKASEVAQEEIAFV